MFVYVSFFLLLLLLLSNFRHVFFHASIEYVMFQVFHSSFVCSKINSKSGYLLYRGKRSSTRTHTHIYTLNLGVQCSCFQSCMHFTLLFKRHKTSTSNITDAFFFRLLLLLWVLLFNAFQMRST